MSINRIHQCTNCGLTGHAFRNCMAPVTSYGLIAVKYTNCNIYDNVYSKSNTLSNCFDAIQFLLIQRKDSLAYVEFIRGKYNPDDDEYIGRLLRGMTIKEHQNLITCTFDELWKGVWGEASPVKTHKNDYETSDKKFALIHEKIGKLVETNPTKWDEPEWGFPKGRRNPHESDLSCAIREFQEETTLLRNDFTVLQNINPISETFFGSNQVHYCHKYYIAICPAELEVVMNMANPHMAREIGNIKWCTLDDAISKIRPDNVEKREILLKAGKIMRNFYPVNTNDNTRTLNRV